MVTPAPVGCHTLIGCASRLTISILAWRRSLRLVGTEAATFGAGPRGRKCHDALLTRASGACARLVAIFNGLSLIRATSRRAERPRDGARDAPPWRRSSASGSRSLRLGRSMRRPRTNCPTSARARAGRRRRDSGHRASASSPRGGARSGLGASSSRSSPRPHSRDFARRAPASAPVAHDHPRATPSAAREAARPANRVDCSA